MTSHRLCKLVPLIMLLTLLFAACTPLGQNGPVSLNTATPRLAADDPLQLTSHPDPTYDSDSIRPHFPSLTEVRPTHLDVEEDLLQGIQITLMHPWQGETSTKFESLVEGFNQTNSWGIKVNLVSKRGPDELFKALQDTLYTSETPQIAMLHPYQAQQLNGDHLWLDLIPYLYDENWGLDNQVLADIPEDILSSHMLGENLIGFPALLSANVIFYNQTWAQELGFESPPATLPELREQSCLAYQALLNDGILDNNGTGGLLLDLEPSTALSWYHAFGGTQLPQAQLLSFNNPQGQQSFAYIKALYDDGCAWVGRQIQPFDYFSQRMALFYTSETLDIPAQIKSLSAYASQDQWLMLPYPSLDKQGSLLFDPLSFIVSIDKPEAQLASWLLIRYLTENTAQLEMAEVTGALPIAKTALQVLFDRPEWRYLSGVEKNGYFTPIRANWSVESMLLQDAFLRSLTLDASSQPTILQLLDETLLEISEMNFDE